MIRLTPDKVAELMTRFSYKPNSVFEVLPSEPSMLPSELGYGIRVYDGVPSATIKAMMYVPDSHKPYHPGIREIPYDYPDFVRASMLKKIGAPVFGQRLELIPVGAEFHPPFEMANDNVFWKWLRRTVINTFEAHERDEWFKVDGVAIYDPHLYPQQEHLL